MRINYTHANRPIESAFRCSGIRTMQLGVIFFLYRTDSIIFLEGSYITLKPTYVCNITLKGYIYFSILGKFQI